MTLDRQNTILISILFLLHVGAYIALLLWNSVTLISDAVAILVFIAVSFTFSFMAMALTLKAPSWIIAIVGAVGIVGIGISLYLMNIEPEGILTPFVLYLSIGIALAELVVLGDRYWRNRGMSKSING
ncbi:hypothetical protein N24_0015 [Corynebacterium suranareeae]|uniref:Uncharacterized protein n=2 Tax=Corynebacterium suranareeae TaxID=2506452 RepID=A0A160PKU2_9CORY|nr:hypothetical protein N24_0015 [Corynebacterium suranareeae]